ncbi:MAG TPA: 1-(5-phosphoribosyl)-5-[(5-phosphoribosylamino)methylideneamino]imidazole-4-carboxamide isomerase [Candidatus Hydrogenedentes bacterium]|nr:1-(5-phosphoribosyl)-5-[(5-phosphoribosylamino)methylideneamino]imidazole-4-carboxamide isomerase [Candidatus Hydrogenedentota bacterium]
MRIVPAVDIRGGRCVRLIQGDYDRETVFSEDPIAQAQIWYGALGDGIIHIVDLDGARTGTCCIEPQLYALARADIPYEVGGGIRLLETIGTVILAGAKRVVLGTAAHRDPLFLQEACRIWPGRIAVGLDARKGMVALNGWLEETRTPAVEFAQEVADAGAARIIYTDISRDGTMSGPNFEATRAVAKAVGIPVTLSGGVSSIEDIRKARDLEKDGVDEIIIGRALYHGAFTIQEAKAAAQG